MGKYDNVTTETKSPYCTPTHNSISDLCSADSMSTRPPSTSVGSYSGQETSLLSVPQENYDNSDNLITYTVLSEYLSKK